MSYLHQQICFQGHTLFISLAFAVRIVEALGNAAFLTASFAIIAKEFPNHISTTFVSTQPKLNLVWFHYQIKKKLLSNLSFNNDFSCSSGLARNILRLRSNCWTDGRRSALLCRWLFPTVCQFGSPSIPRRRHYNVHSAPKQRKLSTKPTCR